MSDEFWDGMTRGARNAAQSMAWNQPTAQAATVDASAPTDPGEGHRTGTGGPDAPGASEGLDAAIEAATIALVTATTPTAHDGCVEDERECFVINPIHFAWYQSGKTGVVGEAGTIAEAAVRAAEPILRQAVAEQIAAEIERNASLWEDYGQHPDGIAGARRAASIAREMGRG